MTRPERLDVLPFCRHLLVEDVNLVAQLCIAVPQGLFVRGRQVLPVNFGQRIDQPGKELSVGVLRPNSHHLGTFDPFGAQHPLQALHWGR
jgi:hypothetical protein